MSTGLLCVRSACPRLFRAAGALLCLMLGVLTGCERGPADASGSDFSLLAQADERFEQARPGRRLEFPRDHAAHPGFRIEWWYVTANLVDTRGRDWGIQWTLFRSAVTPPLTSGERAGSIQIDPDQDDTNPWQAGQVYLAHFAVSAPHQHKAFQRYGRGGDHGGLRQAGVTAQPFAAWLDDWELASTGPQWLPLRLRAAQDDVAADLQLSSDLPLVLQGEAGFSQKHPDGGGSYYYSHPFLRVSGELQFGDEQVAVTGEAWLDREWSSQFLQQDQQGWDWFALHLDDGSKLMAFQLRSQRGDPYRHAVRLWPDGRRVQASVNDFRLQVRAERSVAGRSLPLEWELEWRSQDLDLQINAALDEQWMDLDFPYWEGRVEVRDAATQLIGKGYLEMTGYNVQSR